MVAKKLRGPLQFKFRRFEITRIKHDGIVGIVGARGGGKTTILEDIQYYHRSIPIATLICPTKEVRKEFAKHMPESFIHDKYSPELMTKILRRQDRALDVCKNPHHMLIMDDCLAEAKIWTKDEQMKHVFLNGRHDKILLLFTMQFSIGIPPDLRGQIDYLFILREPRITNRERLYKHYASMFPTFEVFCRVMDAFTENYECLVLDFTTRSNKIEDQVFYYKAKIHEPFTIGCQSYWNYHYKQFNTRYNDERAEKEEEIERMKVKYGDKFDTVLIRRE